MVKVVTHDVKQEKLYNEAVVIKIMNHMVLDSEKFHLLLYGYCCYKIHLLISNFK